MVIYEYFPIELIQLQEEALKHPPLVLAINQSDATDLGERLAIVCHYVGIAIDDLLSQADTITLASKLTAKLYEMRTGIVTLH